MKGLRDLDHTQICQALNVERHHSLPTWKPYAVQLTKVEILVEGTRMICWGGGIRCGKCGYGIDIKPEVDVCPKCGYDGWDVKKVAV